jgi:two-component system cell cycle sensor histidine kinase/response regulator CckA
VRGAEVVLLVEDETSVRRLIVRGLEQHGYQVLAASDGAAALRIEAQHRGAIALLITDVVMPGISGRELADAIKARRPAIKVLFISGYTDDEVLRHGVVVAHDAFFQKPFTPLALLARVREVLDPA